MGLCENNKLTIKLEGSQKEKRERGRKFIWRSNWKLTFLCPGERERNLDLVSLKKTKLDEPKDPHQDFYEVSEVKDKDRIFRTAEKRKLVLYQGTL